MKTSDVNNRADILDSRDVEERITELEEARDADLEPGAELTEEQRKAWDTSEEGEELAALLALREEAEGYSDWQHGATLIRDSWFIEYAKQYADDIGRVEGAASWPYNHIDWEAAAEDLQQDYTSVEFDGVVYWVR